MRSTEFKNIKNASYYFSSHFFWSSERKRENQTKKTVASSFDQSNRPIYSFFGVNASWNFHINQQLNYLCSKQYDTPLSSLLSIKYFSLLKDKKSFHIIKRACIITPFVYIQFFVAVSSAFSLNLPSCTKYSPFRSPHDGRQ